jgi:hypothetical protein
MVTIASSLENCRYFAFTVDHDIVKLTLIQAIRALNTHYISTQFASQIIFTLIIFVIDR